MLRMVVARVVDHQVVLVEVLVDAQVVRERSLEVDVVDEVEVQVGHLVFDMEENLVVEA